jgi:hypothetical protein
MQKKVSVSWFVCDDDSGTTQFDRSTVTYAVVGDPQPKIFNIMFALGEPPTMRTVQELVKKTCWRRIFLSY